MAEAGIEEALTHLFHNASNRATEGWTLVDGNVVKERWLGSNKVVTIITAANPPEIIAKAYVQVPLRTNFIEPPRTIRATTTNDALFAKGMVAKGQIDLSGNRIMTDSFDSTDPAYSTNGRYDPAKNKDGGDVATNAAVIDSLNVWNAEIYGKASTGPGGTVRIGPTGSVGSKAWHAAGKKGLEPGWTSDDMNIYFPEVKAPFSGGAFSIGGTGGLVDGVNYSYILGPGNYETSELELRNQQMLVTGHAVLYVRGDVEVSGLGGIRIAPGGSLKLFVKGNEASLGGNGVINETGNAANFSYYGLPSNKSVTMAGNATFVGTIYAPNAALTLSGSGSSDTDFVGSSVSNTVKMNGHFKFHYDESLGKFGPRRGYTVTSWNEI